MRKIAVIVALSILCGCGAKIESVEMDSSLYQVGAEDEQELKYNFSPEDAKPSQIKWISSDETVAVVKNNMLIGIGPGDCTITAKVGNTELTSFKAEVHTHNWEDVIQVLHHDEEGHFRAWDETVVDQAAWDETVVDQAAWDETVLVQSAWDETVVDQYAWDEKVIDSPAKEPDCYHVYICECGYASSVEGNVINHANRYGHSRAFSGRTECSGGSPEVSHYVHHDAVTHIVHHPDEYGTVHHEAVTHIVHHDAVTHVVHHDAITEESEFSKGNKDYWVVDKAAWDEDVVIGYKCSVCEKTKDNQEGIDYINNSSE